MEVKAASNGRVNQEANEFYENPDLTSPSPIRSMVIFSMDTASFVFSEMSPVSLTSRPAWSRATVFCTSMTASPVVLPADCLTGSLPRMAACSTCTSSRGWKRGGGEGGVDCIILSLSCFRFSNDSFFKFSMSTRAFLWHRENPHHTR